MELLMWKNIEKFITKILFVRNENDFSQENNHFLDEDFYDKVKVKLGMRISLDFHKRHGKKVGSFCFVIIENIFVRVDFI